MTLQPLQFSVIAKLLAKQDSRIMVPKNVTLANFRMNVVLFFWWCRLSAGLVPHREDDLQLLGMAKTNSYHQLVTNR